MLEIYRNSTTEKRLLKLEQPESRCWLNYTDPNKDELEKLSNMLDLSSDVLLDSIDRNELPRLKCENDNVIVFLRAARKCESEFSTVPLTIIFAPNYIVTISIKELNILQDMINDPRTAKFSHKSNFMITIMQSIVKYNERYINTINNVISQHRHSIKKIQKVDIEILVAMEETLNMLIDDLVLNLNVFRKLHSVEKLNFYEDDKKLIDDIIHDGAQVLDLGQSNLRTISNHRDGLATILNLRLNRIMEVLTYVMVFFSIPTVMAGLFGMNVTLPLENHPFGFFIIMGISMLIVLLTFVALWFTLHRR